MTRLLAALAVLTATLTLASLLIGPAGTAPGEALAALVLGGEGPLPIVMREIRLPRALLGVAVGAALGLSGAALQGYLRNPLAEPGLLGISGAAALGAVIAIHGGLAATVLLGLPLAAMAGAAAGAGLLVVLAGPRGGSVTLILAGIAIAALAGAGTALVLNLSPNPYAASEIVFWMMGSLADRSLPQVALAVPPMALGAWLIAGTARGLDALTLGESAAAALGAAPARLRWRLVAGIALLVGPATAVAGSIGFVGLIVPHLLRGATGAMPSRLLPAAALGGAALLLAADIAVRIVMPDRDLKLGVLTALLGAPLFLHLVWQTRAGGRL